MYLIGASGHAKVILDCLKNAGVTVIGMFDKKLSLKSLKGIPVLGDYTIQNPEEPLLIAIGSNRLRSQLAQKYNHKKFEKAIDPSALIAEDVAIGDGTVILHGSIIQSSSIIGNHCIVNTAASIDHDCVIGDYVHIAPRVALCGAVSVGEGTLIGVGAVVVPGIKIGKWCSIGAGSVIIKDVPNYAVVVGNPGRIIKYNDEV
jgi:sugar O-acyltransferase (sialic acid O-acetyltransferase NeuD family)